LLWFVTLRLVRLASESVVCYLLSSSILHVDYGKTGSQEIWISEKVWRREWDTSATPSYMFDGRS
jgi:hypothetical protein